MKYIIAGGRNFRDFPLLWDTCEKIISNDDNVEIVSGTANGADKLGEHYARLKDYSVKQFPADWSLGKQGGYIRNTDMGNYADVAIIFWDGESRGTSHMINIMKDLGKPYHIIEYL
jgi:hypothetical protein